MTAVAKKQFSVKEIPCPFCSLLCDDLVIGTDGHQLELQANACDKAVGLFASIENSTSYPEIKGKKVSLDDAISESVRILKRSKQPLISGLATDVNGVRSALALADRIGATVDHMHGEGAIRNIRVLQDHGWMMTTMAEIKNRADLIIFAGTDAVSNYPRFFDRVVWNNSALFNKKTRERDIIYIGEKLDTSAGKITGGKKPEYLSCKQDQIGEILSTLHALLNGTEIKTQTVAGNKITLLRTLAEKMKMAKYGVIVWAPGELNFPHAELTVKVISDLVKYMNRETRFAGFALGGNDGGMSANSVCSWQSGYPLRVNFSNGYPEYDPYKFSTGKVLKRMEADSMMWISSFNSSIKPPNARIPRIILSSNMTHLPHKPSVFIPVGIPGIDHGGQLIRTDSVVSLKMKQLINRNLPSVADVINRITAALKE